MSFSKETYSIYFEHNRNSSSRAQKYQKSSSLEHGPKSGKTATAFLKLRFHLC